jgi:16S rRNA A1518/A1519 N6-dimethyltransferase RsmA/KsgA/DIM1 with predicted DNA glycosylase/AP lyase activity
MDTRTRKTIEDFGDQWNRYTDNSGFYGSSELLTDIVAPLLSVSDFDGKVVLEVGSGSGRIVRMLMNAARPEKVIAIEPSQAYDVLLENLFQRDGRQDRPAIAT